MVSARRIRKASKNRIGKQLLCAFGVDAGSDQLSFTVFEGRRSATLWISAAVADHLGEQFRNAAAMCRRTQ